MRFPINCCPLSKVNFPNDAKFVKVTDNLGRRTNFICLVLHESKYPGVRLWIAHHRFVHKIDLSGALSLRHGGYPCRCAGPLESFDVDGRDEDGRRGRLIELRQNDRDRTIRKKGAYVVHTRNTRDSRSQVQVLVRMMDQPRVLPRRECWKK